MTKQQAKAQMGKLVGNNIRVERELRHLSVDDVSDMMATSSSHLELIEAGEQEANVLDLSMLANIFGVPVDRFFVNRDKDNVYDMATGDDEVPICANRETVYSLTASLNGTELNLVVDTIKRLLKGDALSQ